MEVVLTRAATQVLREIRPDGRDALGRHCQLLHAANEVPLGFVEGLNNRIRVRQRRAYGFPNEDYLRLKILTCMLPKL